MRLLLTFYANYQKLNCFRSGSTKQIKPNELNREQRRNSISQLKHEFENHKMHTKVMPKSCKGNKKSKFRMKKNTKKKIQTK